MSAAAGSSWWTLTRLTSSTLLLCTSLRSFELVWLRIGTTCSLPAFYDLTRGPVIQNNEKIIFNEKCEMIDKYNPSYHLNLNEKQSRPLTALTTQHSHVLHQTVRKRNCDQQPCPFPLERGCLAGYWSQRRMNAIRNSARSIM